MYVNVNGSAFVMKLFSLPSFNYKAIYLYKTYVVAVVASSSREVRRLLTGHHTFPAGTRYIYMGQQHMAMRDGDGLSARF
jgi:hypothetical protein